MNWTCLFGRHAWRKLGGPRHSGAVFEQTLVCTRCGKRRIHRS